MDELKTDIFYSVGSQSDIHVQDALKMDVQWLRERSTWVRTYLWENLSFPNGYHFTQLYNKWENEPWTQQCQLKLLLASQFSDPR